MVIRKNDKILKYTLFTFQILMVAWNFAYFFVIVGHWILFALHRVT